MNVVFIAIQETYSMFYFAENLQLAKWITGSQTFQQPT